MAAYEEASAIVAELTAAHPDVVEHQRILSWCYNNIGVLRYQEGRRDRGPGGLRAIAPDQAEDRR